MAGHSHWAGIKHKKAAVDIKRSKLWSKLSKAIIVAARLGGGDPAANVRLRNAITDAKSLSMPKENIERAIKRGVGELGGDTVEEILYEGYGSGGVAILCDIMTDNRNRTAADVRKIFEVHGGKLGSAGCVSYLFERKGLIAVATANATEEKVMEIALEFAVDEIQTQGDQIELISPPESFQAVVEALESAGMVLPVKEITRLPSTMVDTDLATARSVLKLMEALEDNDDVQSVASNLNIPAELL